MNVWLKALLFFSLPATSISALGVYHSLVKKKEEKTVKNCCKECPEKCKNQECCKKDQCVKENCSKECCKNCCEAQK